MVATAAFGRPGLVHRFALGRADRASPRQLLEGIHRAMVAMSAHDFADLHAPDAAVYEVPLFTPARPSGTTVEKIRVGFGAAWFSAPVQRPMLGRDGPRGVVGPGVGGLDGGARSVAS